MERKERRSRGRVRDVGLVLGGGALLYLAMVACSGGASQQAGGDASITDALMDLLSPNNDANAQSNPTIVSTTCNIQDGTNFYATANFPGKTVEQLASVYVIDELPSGGPQGTTHQVVHTGLRLKPGTVLYVCGFSGTIGSTGSIRFVLP